MRCRHVEQLLSDRLERALPGREAEAVTAHLSDCAPCRRRADEFAAIGTDLRGLAERVSPPDLERRVVDRWSTELEPNGTHPRSRLLAPTAAPRLTVGWPAWRAAAGLAAAMTFLLALLAFPLLRRDRGRAPEILNPPVVPSREASRPAPSLAPKAPRRGIAPRGPWALRNTDPSARPNRVLEPLRPSLAATRSRGPSPVSPPSPGKVEDELISLNGDPSAEARRWVPAARDAWASAEERLRRAGPAGDDFVHVPFPRLADLSGRQIAAAVESYKQETAVVDARLARPVTLQLKATALSDLCESLRADTGLQLTAGQSVVDEKVTLFCKKLPLREVMRQLSRPFGYTWLRSGKQGEFRYELVQDLRSQLLEEELRNRDRNAALLAIDRDMSQYRSYLGLSPAELRARASRTDPNAPKVPKHFAGTGWGPLQLYSRLSPHDLAALRAGQTLTFSAAPEAGEPQLPPDLTRGVLESVHDRRILKRGDTFDVGPVESLPDGLPPARVPEARALVVLRLDRSELGQLTLVGMSGFSVGTPPSTPAIPGPPNVPTILGDDGPIAVGVSPTVRNPENAVANAKLERDAALRPRVTVRPRSSCWVNLSPGPSPKRGGVTSSRRGMPRPEGAQRHDRSVAGDKLPLPASGRRGSRAFERAMVFRPLGGGGRAPGGGEVNPPKVTTADVLEAVHHATGLPLVADYYTRLYPASELSVQDMPLFDALNRLADTMRLRWTKEGSWLQFRTTSYFNDRLKEVPNRLLTRWMASRREHGALTLDDLVEIAQLSDAQLDSVVMAEGAGTCLGLTEWTLARNDWLRPNWRYLATLTPAQRLAAASAAGLPFRQMTLAQQQQFIALAFSHGGEAASAALEDLAGATVRVDYRLPGNFEWKAPDPAGGAGRRGLLPSPVRERTREDALRAARWIDARADETQIVPTELSVTMIYAPGGPDARLTPLVIRADSRNTLCTPPRKSAAIP